MSTALAAKTGPGADGPANRSTAMAMAGSRVAQEPYLELIALLIDREIARFRRGEQAALVTFVNVAKLAENASAELWDDPLPSAPLPSDDLQVCGK